MLCSVALSDADGGKAAFHAMLDVEPPTYHQDIAIDDVSPRKVTSFQLENERWNKIYCT